MAGDRGDFHHVENATLKKQAGGLVSKVMKAQPIYSCTLTGPRKSLQ